MPLTSLPIDGMRRGNSAAESLPVFRSVSSLGLSWCPMIDAELIALLACPESKEPVHLAEPALIERLNRAISSGKVHKRGGDAVTELLDGGLVRADGKILYPIRDDIPIMLVEEGIPLPVPG
jgi:uncharacterized protein YbaR (Trm112 family)